MTKLLISYRRADTAPIAGRLFDRLAEEFGKDCVFMDIDTIRPGFDFIDEISKAIRSADAVLALIGDGWSTAKDANGNRRIENVDDPVRLEIATALQADIRVIPVLVGNARMPIATDLPDELASLPRLHAVALDPGRRFHRDVDDLIASIQTESQTSPKPVLGNQTPGKLIATVMLIVGAMALSVAFWPKGEPVEPERSTAPQSMEEAPKQIADNPADTAAETAEPSQFSLSLDPISMRNDQFVRSITFSPDGEILATTNTNETISLWQVTTGEEMFRLRPSDAIAAVFSPDGDSLATRRYGTDVVVWNTRDGSEKFRFSSSEEFGITNGLAFTPDGQRIITANSTGAIQIRNAANGSLIRQIVGEKNANSLAVNRDGSLVAIGFGVNDLTGIAAIWEIESGTKVATLSHQSLVWSVAFSPDGETLAVGWGQPSEVGGATLWDVATGEETGILGSGGRTLRDRLESGVSKIGFSNDGRLIATQSFDGSGMVRLWDSESLGETARFEHSRGVSDFAFSPDDLWIASSTYGGTISIWDIATARQLVRATHEPEVHAVAFSADGQFIAGDVGSGVLYRVTSNNAPKGND